MEKWFDYEKARFLIRALDPILIKETWARIEKGEVSKTEGLRVLFDYALVEFKDIPGAEWMPRREKVKVLFEDPEIQTFVIFQASDLLEAEVQALERLRNQLERYLLLSGRLKS